MNFEDLAHEISFYITPKNLFNAIIKVFEEKNIELDYKNNLIILDKNKEYKSEILFDDKNIKKESKFYSINFDKENNELNVKFKNKENISFNHYEIEYLFDYEFIIKVANILKLNEDKIKLDEIINIYQEIYNMNDKTKYYFHHFENIILHLNLMKELKDISAEKLIEPYLKNEEIKKGNIKLLIATDTYDKGIYAKLNLNGKEITSHYSKIAENKIYEKKAIRDLKKGDFLQEELAKEFDLFTKKMKTFTSYIDIIKGVRRKLNDKNLIINKDLLDVQQLNDDGKNLGPEIFKLINEIEIQNDNIKKRNKI